MSEIYFAIRKDNEEGYSAINLKNQLSNLKSRHPSTRSGRTGFWIAHPLGEVVGRPFMLRQAQHERPANYFN